MSWVRYGESACRGRVTAAIHNRRPASFCYVAVLDDYQGSHPVPPWYVDTVAFIHKEREGGGLKCECVRDKLKEIWGGMGGGGKGQFTVQPEKDNSSNPSKTAKHSISKQQHRARYKCGVINKCTAAMGRDNDVFPLLSRVIELMRKYKVCLLNSSGWNKKEKTVIPHV